MTRRIATYLSAISVAVLFTGCIYMPESGVAARRDFLNTNAEGIERANETLAAKIEWDILEAAEVAADRATFADIDSSATLELYLADRAKTRASIRAVREDWMILLDEYRKAASGDRSIADLSNEELEVLHKAKTTIGGK